MSSPSHFETEQVLRRAGIAVRPYPTAAPRAQVADLREVDRQLIEAGSAWGRELERLYAMHAPDLHLARQMDFALRFDTACTEEGMARALVLLNSEVTHRYTGVYRATPTAMVLVELLDKDGAPRPDYRAEVPLPSTFCQYVRDGSFLTGNSGNDTRLNGHPYQGVMLAYCGAPIFNAKGSAIGTVCHFDMVSCDTPEAQVARLHAAASIFTHYIR
ncbi:hypothetical protein [Variovorax paradoxus]|uniref:hypothetical protein n=1 Tax=Variovorax paradoxus TaxID=34073 RepID=UPI001ABC4DC0